LASLDQLITMRAGAGDTLVLIGNTKGHLGQSALLAEVFSREDGDAPEVDLAAERRAGEFVRAAKVDDLITAAHDLGDGGLALGAAEMALAAACGLSIKEGDTGWFFGEDQGRYLLATTRAAELMDAAETADVPATVLGKFDGSSIALGQIKIGLAELCEAFEAGLGNALI